MLPAGHLAQVITVLAWLLAFGWLHLAVTSLRGMSTLADLTHPESTQAPPLDAAFAPHLTVIVPALNEEESIEATLRSLLASTGIVLEIIAVDDRSTDRTGQLMDHVAAHFAGSTPHTLRALHVTELPPGWLGKPHALALAAKEASAPWLLFTDGDVQFHPQALSLALRHAIATRTDHLILVPTLILETFGERAVLTAMQLLALWGPRLWKVSDPQAKDFMGVGAFTLVRREVYDQIGGFNALRMEVVEDLRFGLSVKRSGRTQRAVLGPGLVRIRWIDGAFSVVHLMEKNGFAIFRFREALTLLALFGLVLQITLPLAAFAAGPLGFAAGATIYASILLTARSIRRMTGASPWFGLFFAPATAIVVYGFARSMALTLFRGSIEWRGTRYPLAELRRHAGRSWN